MLFLSMPSFAHAQMLDEAPSPIGFILSKSILVTVRYAKLRSFDSMATKFSKSNAPASSIETFTAIVDEIVDLSADLLEGIAAELDMVSRSVFLKTARKRSKVTRSNDALHGTLIDVGNAGGRLARIRGSLLSLQQIVPFVSEPRLDWIANNMRSRLKNAQVDLVCLADYETHLSGNT